MARLPEPDSAALPTPRHAWLIALGVCVAATMILGWPALTGQFLVNPHSDQYIAGYPFREFASDVLRRTGGFALWNPYLFGGMPFVGAMHGDIFYPTFLLREVLPTDVAMTWGYILHMFLAGWATWRLARALGFTFAGALVAGLAYMLSGWIASYVSPGHDGKLFVSALYPLTLWALLRGVRDGRTWAWGAVALLVGLAALSPHPQLLQYMLVGSGVFSLWVAFGMGAASPPRAVAVRRLAFALGAVLLGGAISAVQYLPVREYTAFSPRAGGARGYDYNTSFSFPPEELINTLIPEFTGILRDYFGRNGIHLHNEYVGAAVWVLVVAAFRRQVRERQTWLWLGMAILFTLWALGGFTPFYRLIWAIVPGTKYFRAPSTVFFVAQLALAMLAGLGAQGALLRPVSRRFLTIGAVVAVAITLAGASGMLTGLGGAFAGPGRELMVEANATHVMTGTLRAMAFLALTLALLWSVGAGKLRPALASWALVAIIVVDQATVLNRYWLFSEKASVIYAPDATIAHVRQATATEPGRVLALPMGDGLVARDAMLTGSGLMAARVRSVTGYHGNELARYQALVGGEAELANLLDGNPNVQQLLNMRWILSGVPDMSELPFRGGGPRRVAGPARNASGSMVYLHELREPNPFAWVAPVIVKAPDEATLQTILDPRFPVASVALFDTSAAVQGRTDLAAPPPVLTLPVRTTKYEPGAIDLELGAPAPAGSALVVSENFYPGWTATIDGKPAVAHRAMYTLIGVPLEPGARRVSLRFTSATYETGKTVTLVALALALLLLGAGVVLGRRTPTSGVATG